MSEQTGSEGGSVAVGGAPEPAHGSAQTSIEIVDLVEAGEDGGGLLGWYAKGHHGRIEFAHACNAYTGATSHYDTRWCHPDDVSWEWWRTVPCGPSEPGYVQYHPATPGSRGAYRVTVWEWQGQVQRRRWQQYQQGRRQGMRDCFDWVLRNLPRDVGDALFEVWRREQPAERLP